MEPEAAAPTYVPELDSLRAVAVLGVVVFHLYLFPIGWMGVPLFFVLSGFLITRILMADRGRDLRDYMGRFYWRRTLRIFPLYYIYLAVNAVYALRYGGGISDYWWFLVYLGNYAVATGNSDHSGYALHFWSLAVEEQFYLIWPLVVYFCHRRLVPLCVAIILLSYLSRILIYHFTGNAYLTILSLPSCMDMLAAGALAAVLSDRRYLLVMGAAGLLLVTAGFWSVGYQDFGLPTGWVPKANYMYTGLALLFAPLMRFASGVRVLNLRWPRYIGRISYGIYVWHLLAFVVASRIAGNTPLYPVLAVILSIVVAALSWRFFEAPILRYKDEGPSLLLRRWRISRA